MWFMGGWGYGAARRIGRAATSGRKRPAAKRAPKSGAVNGRAQLESEWREFLRTYRPRVTK